MRWPAMQSWCKSRNSPPKAATDPGLHQVAAASEFDEFDGLVKLHRWNLLWMWLESETATLFLRYSDIAWALQQCNKICNYMSFCGAASKIFPKQGILWHPILYLEVASSTEWSKECMMKWIRQVWNQVVSPWKIQNVSTCSFRLFSRWWFRSFFFFIHIWGMLSWLILFEGVETTD